MAGIHVYNKNSETYEGKNVYDITRPSILSNPYTHIQDSHRTRAQYIVKNRPITTTLELVDVINDAVGNKYFNLNHPERRIFQALRIEVNQELKVIEAVLPQVIDLLKPEGRCAIITFHSLEDRIVKQYFKTKSKVNELVKGLPKIPLEYKPKIKLITKKPLTASKEELQENSRSKSAKLRVIERI